MTIGNSRAQYLEQQCSTNTSCTFYIVLLFAKSSNQLLGKFRLPQVTYTCNAGLTLHTLKACRAASPWPESISSLAFLPIMVAPSSSSGSNLARVSNSSAPFMASSSTCNPSAASPSQRVGKGKRWGAWGKGKGQGGKGGLAGAPKGRGGVGWQAEKETQFVPFSRMVGAA